MEYTVVCILSSMYYSVRVQLFKHGRLVTFMTLYHAQTPQPKGKAQVPGRVESRV